LTTEKEITKCKENLKMLSLLLCKVKLNPRKIFSFPSMCMALNIFCIICFPVAFVHAENQIAKISTETEVAPIVAKRIISIQSEEGDHVFKFHIIGDGKLKNYNYFSLEDPHRFVIDLMGVQSSVRQKTWPTDSPLIKKIRLGISHKNKVRVVFDLFPDDQHHYEFKVFPLDDQLIVVIGSGSDSDTVEKPSKIQEAAELSEIELDDKIETNLTESAEKMESAALQQTSKELEEEEGRAYYDLGVFAFEDGDYEDAEKNLLKALEFNPTNPFYNHYLGKTYLEKKSYQKAENHLNVAWNVNPEISGLKYDLAILNSKMSRYSRAADLFAEIAEEDPSNVLALYFAGVNFYKHKQYEKAVDYFIDASEKSPSIKANGYYYAGICLLKLGKTEYAVEKIEYVRDHARSQSLKDAAIKWLKAIEAQKKALRPYSIYLKLGYQYDSNVRVEPLDQDIYPDEGDFAAVGYLSGKYYFVNRKAIKLGAGYSHYQTRHNELREYDLIGSIFNLDAKYRLDPFAFGFSYIPSFYWLDSDKFQKRHEFRPDVMWRATRSLVVTLTYSYYINDYFQDNDRDGRTHEGFLNAFYSIGKKGGYLFGGVGYEKNSASSADQDFGQLKTKLGLSFNIPWGLIVSLTGKYYDKKWDNVDSLYGVKREDVKYYGSISLSRKIFFDWLSISGEYNYTKNDSNIKDYKYDRNVGTLSLTVNF
jgi:tetratricopeptide (TPR) repeat protein